MYYSLISAALVPVLLLLVVLARRPGVARWVRLLTYAVFVIQVAIVLVRVAGHEDLVRWLVLGYGPIVPIAAYFHIKSILQAPPADRTPRSPAAR